MKITKLTTDKNNIKSVLDNMINEIDENTYIIVAVGNCLYQRLFVNDWSQRNLPNKVNIINLDPECFSEYNNVLLLFLVGWILYYISLFDFKKRYIYIYISY